MGFRALALGLLLAVPDARAESSAHGRLFGDAYGASEHSSKRFHELSAAAWLQLEQRWNEADLATATGEGIVNGNSSTHPDAGAEANLREAYLTHSPSGLDFRVGKQIIPWGKSDGFNPTDVLTAKNYARFNTDEEVRRVGAPTALLAYTPRAGASPVTFTAVFNGVAPKSTLLVPSTSIPSIAVIDDPRRVPVTWANSEQAVKISYFTPAWDFSVMGFRGKDHLPDLTNGGFSGGLLHLVPVFHSLRVVGADSSVTFKSWVARLESAYYQTENADGKNPLIEAPHWDSVVGVERPFGDYVRVNLQGIFKYIPQFTRPDTLSVGSNPVDVQTNQSVAAANALLHAYQEASRLGASTRITVGNDRWPAEFELFSLYYPTTKEWMVRPKVSYAWADSFKTSLGLEQYYGSTQRPLGAYKEYNSVFLEARFVF